MSLVELSMVIQVIVIPWFVRLNEETKHELKGVDYLPYNWIYHGMIILYNLRQCRPWSVCNILFYKLRFLARIIEAFFLTQALDFTESSSLFYRCFSMRLCVC